MSNALAKRRLRPSVGAQEPGWFPPASRTPGQNVGGDFAGHARQPMATTRSQPSACIPTVSADAADCSGRRPCAATECADRPGRSPNRRRRRLRCDRAAHAAEAIVRSHVLCVRVCVSVCASLCAWLCAWLCVRGVYRVSSPANSACAAPANRKRPGRRRARTASLEARPGAGADGREFEADRRLVRCRSSA